MKLRSIPILSLILAALAGAQILAPISSDVHHSSGGGSVTYSASSGGECFSSTGSCQSGSPAVLTISATVGSLTNGILIVTACVSGGSSDVEPTISSVVYNGSESLTQQRHSSGNYYCDIWYRLAPSSGTHNVVITTSATLVGTAYMGAAVVSFSHVNQSSPFVASSPADSSGSGASATLTLGAAGGSSDGGFEGVCSGTTGAKTPGGSQTTRVTEGGDDFGACNTFSLTTSGGTVTAISWSIPSDFWRTIGAILAHD